MHAHQNLHGIHHCLHGNLIKLYSEAIIPFWKIVNDIVNMVWIMRWEYNGLPVWRFPNTVVSLHRMFEIFS